MNGTHKKLWKNMVMPSKKKWCGNGYVENSTILGSKEG